MNQGGHCVELLGNTDMIPADSNINSSCCASAQLQYFGMPCARFSFNALPCSSNTLKPQPDNSGPACFVFPIFWNLHFVTATIVYLTSERLNIGNLESVELY